MCFIVDFFGEVVIIEIEVQLYLDCYFELMI